MATEEPLKLHLDEDVHSVHQYAIDLLRKPVAQEPAILWHYTTADGLLGIVQNKHIRMSHITCMNDSEEYRHGIRHLIDAATIRLQSGLPSHLEKLHQALIRPLTNMMNIRRIPDIFVACLSEETDALTHWIEYGQQGVGYAIGFDIQKLKAVTENSTNPLLSPIVSQCIYRDDIKRNTILNLLGRAEEVFGETVTQNQQTSVDFHVNRFVSHFILTVVLFGPVFKHSIFEPEHEWRMIAFDRTAGLGAEFITRQNEIREIMKLPIGEGAASAIAEVKIGSNRDERLREIGVTVVERFLKAAGLGHVKVAESMSPYRFP